MPTYPIYHQNWDGGSGSYPPGYGDWNLSGSVSYSVGTPSLTSSPDALQLASNTDNPRRALTKLAAESSADGTISAYTKTYDQTFIGVLGRAQGQSVNFGDFKEYFLYYWCDLSVQANSYLEIYESNTQAHLGKITNVPYNATYTYIIEFRLSGSSLKARMYDKTNNLWLQPNSTWASTPTDAISATDTIITTAGRVGVAQYGAVAKIVDDFFWDAPAPILSQSTASLTVGGGTVTLTAGGFSDPLAGVTWGSSNTGVATVSGGVVTPVAAGTATITATGVADTGQTATCAATVTAVGGPFPWFTPWFCDYNFAQK